MGSTQLPDKLFFKIGEVADIVGVRSHVLRYWESEFSGLKPMKTRGSHRVYRRKDVELAMLIRRLLHDEGYTISGAKKKLKESARHKVEHQPDPAAVREVGLRAELLSLRRMLSELLIEVEAALPELETAPTPRQPHPSVKVERVVHAPATRSVLARATPATRHRSGLDDQD